MMTECVVDLFESIEVHEHYGRRIHLAFGRAHSLAYSLLEQSSVGQTGQSIVKCKVFVLSSLTTQMVDEAPVLERRARVVDERLEQAEVILVESVEVTQPVRNMHRAQLADVDAEGGDHGVRDVRLNEERPEP